MSRENRGYFLDRHENDRWYICWYVAGKLRSRSTGTKDRGAAEAAYANFILALADTPDPTDDPPISVALAQYWDEHGQHLAARETCKLNLAYLGAHFGAITAGAFKKADVREYKRLRAAGKITFTRDDGTTGGGRAGGDGTQRRELGVLVAALNWAAGLGHGNESDGDKRFLGLSKKVNLPADPPAKERALTDVEIEKLVETAAARRGPGERLGRAERFVWLGLHTLGRMEAIQTLSWSKQVDFETGVIHLNPPGRRQTKKRRASVPISNELLPVLRRMYEERVGDWVLDHPGSVEKTVDTLFVACGFKDVTPHTLRHSGASQMRRRGKSIEDIAKVLGDTIATTEKRYAHINPGELRDAVNAIGGGIRAVK